MDVLVAGAGPVGLFAAHSLAKDGLSVGVVDTGVWACSHSYALALHPASMDLLSKAGLADSIASDAHLVKRIAVYDSSRERASVSLDESRPMAVLPQSALEAGLESSLNKAGVQVQWKHKVTAVEPHGDRVRVTLNRYEKESRGYVIARTEWAITKTWTVEVPWLIGADGYSSAVRRSLGIGFPETGPAAYYGVFEFQSDASGGEVRIVLGDRTTDVLWPLGQGRFRWSFELPNYVDPEVERQAASRARYGDPSDRVKERSYDTGGDVGLLPDEQLHQLIAARVPWFSGSVNEIGWRTVVRFERRVADSYGRGRCWLAGDAAHTGAPLGVQSLNAGLAEARMLADTLSGSPTAEALGRYGSDRRLQWTRMQSPVVALADVDPWIWENRERLLPCLPGYGDGVAPIAAGFGLRLGSA